MSAKEDKPKLGSELLSKIEAGGLELQELVERIESPEYTQVNAAALDLAETYGQTYRRIEAVGFSSLEARDSLVNMLLLQEVYDHYGQRLTEAQTLSHRIDEGIWIRIEIFAEYLQDLLAGARTFGLSQEEIGTLLLEHWLPHLDLVKQFTALEKYTELPPLSKTVEQMLENESLPPVVKTALLEKFLAGKTALKTKVFDKNDAYMAENSVSLAKISKRYSEIHNDAMLLLMADTYPPLRDVYLAKAVAVLDRQEVMEAFVVDPYDKRVRDVILSVSYLLGFGDTLRNELRRLTLTENDLLMLFTAALSESLEEAMGLLDVGLAVYPEMHYQFRRVLLEYIEHFLMQEVTIIQCGESPVVVSTSQPWNNGDLEELSLLLEDLEIPKDDYTYLQALERNEIKLLSTAQ